MKRKFSTSARNRGATVVEGVGAKATKLARRRGAISACIESLESRRLLTAVAVQLTQTPGNDVFTISRNGGQITVTTQTDQGTPSVATYTGTSVNLVVVPSTTSQGPGTDQILLQTTDASSPLQVLWGSSTGAGTLDTPAITVDVGAATKLTLTSAANLGGLAIHQGGQVNIPDNPTMGTRVLALNTLTFDTSAAPADPDPGQTLTVHGQLDLGDSALVVHAPDFTLLRQYMRSGLNESGSALWDGQGVVSISAAARSDLLYGQGLVLNALGGQSLYGSYYGVQLGTSDALVKYTEFGDADLNGEVNSADVTLLNTGYENASQDWYNGDFNYDGVIDGTDYFLSNNGSLNQPAPIPAATGGQPWAYTLPVSATGESQPSQDIAQQSIDSWTVDFGDGSAPQVITADEITSGSGTLTPAMVSSQQPLKITHTFPMAQALASVHASLKLQGGSVTTYRYFHGDVVVNGVTPDLTLVGPSTVAEGEVYQLLLQPRIGNPQVKVNHSVIDWGDGTTTTTTSLAATHTYDGQQKSATVSVTSYGPNADAESAADGPQLITSPPIRVTVTPATPLNVQYTQSSSTTARVTWTNSSVQRTALQVSLLPVGTAVPGVVSTTNAEGTYTLDTDATAFDFAYLRPGVVYQLKVGNVVGTTVHWAIGTTLIGIPNAVAAGPASVASSAMSDSAISIGWTDANQGAVSYKVQRQDSNGGWATLATYGPGTQTQFAYADNGLAEATSQTYRVLATNGFDQEGQPSDTFTVWTKPSAPTDLTAAPVDGDATKMRLTWTANSTGATGYQIETSADGQSFSTVASLTGTQSTFDVTGLDANNFYTFRVTAVRDTDGSVPAVVREKTAPAGPLPGVVQSLTADTSGLPTTVVLSWATASGAAGYTVERRAGQAGLWVPVATTNNVDGQATQSVTFSSGDYANDTTYFYRVTSSNQYGDATSPSGELAVTTTLPSPSGLTAVVNPDGTVELQWSANSAAASGYRIVSLDGSGIPVETLADVHKSVGVTSVRETLTLPDATSAYRLAVLSYVDPASFTPETRSSLSNVVTAVAVPYAINSAGDSSASFGTAYQLTLTANDVTPAAWSVDWGDGAVESFTPDQSNLSSLTVTHTYAAPSTGAAANYTINARATTADGNVYSDWGHAITVLAPPSPSYVPPPSNPTDAKTVRKAILTAFNNIYNTIDFEPYAGAKKGINGILATKSANDLDQATLLKRDIGLALTSNGYSLSLAQFTYTTAIYKVKPADVWSWLGLPAVHNDDDVVGNNSVAIDLLVAAHLNASDYQKAIDSRPVPDPLNPRGSERYTYLRGLDTLYIWHTQLAVSIHSGQAGDPNAINIDWSLDPSWKQYVRGPALTQFNNYIGTKGIRFNLGNYLQQPVGQSPLDWYEAQVARAIHDERGASGKVSVAGLIDQRHILQKNFTAASVAGPDFTNPPVNADLVAASNQDLDSLGGLDSAGYPVKFTSPDTLDQKPASSGVINTPKGNLNHRIRVIAEPWIQDQSGAVTTTSSELWNGKYAAAEFATTSSDTGVLNVRFQAHYDSNGRPIQVVPKIFLDDECVTPQTFGSSGSTNQTSGYGVGPWQQQGAKLKLSIVDISPDLTVPVDPNHTEQAYQTLTTKDFTFFAGQPIAVMMNTGQMTLSRVASLQGVANGSYGQIQTSQQQGSAFDRFMANQANVLEVIAAKYASESSGQLHDLYRISDVPVVNFNVQYGIVQGVSVPLSAKASTFEQVPQAVNPVQYHLTGGDMSDPSNPTDSTIKVDLPALGNQLTRVVSYDPSDTSSGYGGSVVEAASAVLSYLEGSVIEEVTNRQAISTVRGFQSVLSGGGHIVKLTSSNYTAALATLKTGWMSQDLSSGQRVSTALNDEITKAFADNVGVTGYHVYVPDVLVTRLGGTRFGVWLSTGPISQFVISYSGGNLHGAWATQLSITPPVVAPAQSNSGPKRGDPVNVYSGTLEHEQDLFSLPTPGLAFGVSLHYSSAAKMRQIDNPASFDASKENHGFGIGWMSNFSDYLEIAAASATTQTVTWHTWTGEAYALMPKSGSSSTYENPAGLFGTFVKSGAGYTYTDVTGRVTVFDRSGRLASVGDTNGNKITIAYASDADTVLSSATYQSTVTRADGSTVALARTVVFTGVKSGGRARITSVSDGTGRTWSLDYGFPPSGASAGGQSGSPYLVAVGFNTPATSSGVVNGKQFAWSAAISDRTVFGYDFGTGKTGNAFVAPLSTLSHYVGGGLAGTQQFSYYPNGRAFSTSDGLGHTEYFLYNQFNSYAADQNDGISLTATVSATHIDYNGNVSLTKFNNYGLESEVVGSDGSRRITEYKYYGKSGSPADGKFFRRSVADDLGHITYYFYDVALGKPVHIVESDGTLQQPTDRTAVQGHVTQHWIQYNKFGETTSESLATAADGSRVTSNSYDVHGNLLAATDAGGNKTTYSYYSNGQARTVVSQKTSVDATYYTYDALGQPASQRRGPLSTAATGGLASVDSTVTSDYDPRGNLTSSFDADGGSVWSTYDAFGRLRSRGTYNAGTNGRGTLVGYVAYAYSVLPAADNSSTYVLTRTTTQGGDAPASGWDSEAHDAPTSLVEVFDAFGRVIRTIQNNTDTLSSASANSTSGASTRNTYDGNGNLVATIDPLGRKTMLVYDNRDRRIAIVAPDGSLAVQFYDGAGRVVISETTSGDFDSTNTYAKPAFAQTVTNYDSLGRVASVVDAINQMTAYKYNDFGEVKETDLYAAADDSVPYYQSWVTGRDALGRVTESRDNYGVASSVVFDGDGNVQSSARYDVTGMTKYWDPTAFHLDWLVGADLQWNRGRWASSSADRYVHYTYTRYDAQDRPIAVADDLGQVSRTVYSAGGRVVATVDPRGTSTLASVDQLWDVVFNTVDPNSPGTYTSAMFYDGAGRVTRKVLPDTNSNPADNASITYAYYTDGHLRSQTSPVQGSGGLVNETDYAYSTDVAGRSSVQTKVRYAGWDAQTWAGSATAARQESASTWVVRDGAGQVVSTTDELQKSTTFTYGDNGKKATEVDPAPDASHPARTTAYTYDMAGNLRRILDTTSTTTTEPKPDQWFAYDLLGRQVADNDSLSYHQTIYWQNKVFATQDGQYAPFVVTSEEDLRNWLVGPTIPVQRSNVPGQRVIYHGTVSGSSAPTVTRRDGQSRLSIPNTFFAGLDSATVYNSLGELVQQVAYADPVTPFTTTTYTYDGVGQVTSQSLSGLKTQYAYDAAGNKTAEIQPIGSSLIDGQADQQSREQRKASAIAGNIFTVTRTYDAMNRQLSVTQPDPDNNGVTQNGPKTPSTTTLEYDAVGNVTKQTDGAGNIITSRYDGRGQLFSTSATVYEDAAHPAAVVSDFNLYDAAGRLVKSWNRSGNVASFIRDEVGQIVTEVRYLKATLGVVGPTVPDQVKTYAYDHLGNQTQATVGDGNGGVVTVTTTAYDAEGRVLSMKDSLTHDGTAYTYDSRGNLASSTVTVDTSVKSVTTYAYDAFNHPNHFVQYRNDFPNSGGHPGVSEAWFVYNEQGALTATGADTANGSGSITSNSGGVNLNTDGVRNWRFTGQNVAKLNLWYTYDGAGRLISTKDGRGAEQFGYGYDANSNVGHFTLSGAISWYQNDSAGQLTSTANPYGQVHDYTYDANQNRLTNSDRVTSTSNNIGAGNVLASSGANDGGYTNTYDGNSNLIDRANAAGHQGYSYDASGHLWWTGTFNWVVGGQVCTGETFFTYDAAGTMIAQTDKTYIPGTNTVATSKTRYFTVDLSGNTVQITTDGLAATDAFFYGLGKNQILAATFGDSTTSASGRVSADNGGPAYWMITSQNGSVYEVVTTASKTLRWLQYDAFGNKTESAGPAGQGANAYTPRQSYTGQTWIASAGMYDYGARFYDPRTGRFISNDPAQDGTNWSAYVGNNPATFNDPWGLTAITASTVGGSSGGRVTGALAQTSVYDFLGSLGVNPSGGPSISQLIHEDQVYRSLTNDWQQSRLQMARQDLAARHSSTSTGDFDVDHWFLKGLADADVAVVSGVAELGYRAVDAGNAFTYLASGGLVGSSNLRLSQVSQLQHSGETTWARATFSSVPVVGNVYNAVSGEDLLTGRELKWYEQTAAGFGVVSDVAFTAAAVKLTRGGAARRAGAEVGQTAATGREWYDHLARKYGAENVVSVPGTTGSGVLDTIPEGFRLTAPYPPNRGFLLGPSTETLQPGTLMDRFGLERGTFVAPQGTPVPMRALPPGVSDGSYNIYRVVKPFDVRAGPTAPWYGQPGGGMQYELPGRVVDLLKSGHLERVTK
jgi:RHS repeat-associated protein